MANLEVAMAFIRDEWKSDLILDTLSSIRLVKGECVTILGFVDVDGKPAVPAFGELTLDARLKSPLGAQGQFWFGDLGVGTHLAEVEFREGTCRFELTVPGDAGASVNLGTLSCRGGQVA